MGQSSEGSPSFWKEWQFCKPSSISEGMMSHAGLTCRSSTHSALCTFLEPESCFVVCGGRGLGAAGGLGNSLCLSGPLKLSGAQLEGLF